MRWGQTSLPERRLYKSMFLPFGNLVIIHFYLWATLHSMAIQPSPPPMGSAYTMFEFFAIQNHQKNLTTKMNSKVTNSTLDHGGGEAWEWSLPFSRPLLFQSSRRERGREREKRSLTKIVSPASEKEISKFGKIWQWKLAYLKMTMVQTNLGRCNW